MYHKSRPITVSDGSRHAASSTAVPFADITTAGFELATFQPVNPAELVTTAAAGVDVPAVSRHVKIGKRSVSYGTVCFETAASSLSTYAGEQGPVASILRMSASAMTVACSSRGPAAVANSSSCDTDAMHMLNNVSHAPSSIDCEAILMLHLQKAPAASPLMDASSWKLAGRTQQVRVQVLTTSLHLQQRRVVI